MKNGYDQFFVKAKQAKAPGAASEPADRIRFSVRPPKASPSSHYFKTAKPKPAEIDRKLRQAVKMRKQKAPFPWRAIGGLAVTLFGVGFYLAYPDQFERLLDKVEIRALGQAEAAEGTASKAAEKSTQGGQKAEKAADAGADGGKAKSPDAKSAVNDEFSQFEKLKQRKEELDLREKELNELEEELQRQKVELDKRITQLEDMRNQIAQTLKDRVEVDQEKVNKLVDLYSNMKPQQAANVIGSINEELAVEVLAKMKKKNAAEIMNLLSPEKAKVLSEKYTGYRRISSTDPKG